MPRTSSPGSSSSAPRRLHGRPAFADEVDALRDPVDPEWVRASLTWYPREADVPGWYIEDRVAADVARFLAPEPGDKALQP